MIIVYGIKQYGQGNKITQVGRCGVCGRYGPQSSYDTADFLMLFWIPLIPVGRNRVFDACPVCSYSGEMPLGKYRRQRAKALSAAVEGLESERWSPQKAIEALRTFLTYKDTRSFFEAAPLLGEVHRNNHDVQRFIGNACGELGRVEEGERYLRRAVALHAGRENVKDLARNLLVQERPDDARPLLEYILTDRVGDDHEMLYLLVKAYRAAGRHVDALAILDEMARCDEKVRDDEEYARLRDSSSACASTQTPIQSVALLPRGEVRHSQGEPVWIPYLVPGAIVAFLLGLYLFSAFSLGAGRDVWLVNGTRTQYTVVINGKEFVNPPQGAVKIRLAEGTWHIALRDTPFPVAPETVVFETPFLTRPFRSPTVVLNPDKVALLREEEIVYATRPRAGDEGSYWIHHGKALYSFRGIHFAFIPSPGIINLSEGSAREVRRRLSHCTPESDAQAVDLSTSWLPPEDVPAHFSRALLFEPERHVALDLLFAMAMDGDRESFIGFMTRGLARRPVLTDWHRRYQDVMERVHPAYDLAAEYRGLLRDEPDDRQLMYLLGRVVDDAREAERLFLASEQGTAPIGFGYHALAYHRWCTGRFSESLSFCDQALDAVPDRTERGALRREILCALGRYDDLLAGVRAERESRPYDAELAGLEITYLTLLDRSDEARAVTESYLALLEEGFRGDAAAAAGRAHINAVRIFLTGDVQEYASQLGTSECLLDLFRAALVSGRVEDAARCLSDAGGGDAAAHMLVYCGAVHAGDAALATAMLQRSVDLMGAGGKEERRAAEMLRAESAPDPAELRELGIVPSWKSIIAASLALRFPDRKAEFAAMARAHNFAPRFPQKFIGRMLGR